MKIFEQFIDSLQEPEELPQGFSSEEKAPTALSPVTPTKTAKKPLEQTQNFSFDKIIELSEYERRRSIKNLNL